MRSLLTWIRRTRQHFYCAGHVGDCVHCRDWKRAQAARRR